ncbi:MAG TPA: ABC transporter permease [Ignavibacteria bacterium]|nr:ABC transporter permease [Bacteroidota bacterium]HRI86376.1 ABC transporter permease [Ignavibacteria bacterium]HRJ99153.1 ABC transporter permease [Ignavibacteria bacterium]
MKSLTSDKPKSTFKLTLPESLSDTLIKITGLFLFALKNFKEIIKPPYEFSETLKQFYQIGYKSFSLIAVTGFIIGLTLTLQSIPTLQKFGAASLVPSMVALAVILEIGPVITALIFAGKIGSGIGAELGSMKVTEQIDAMEVSGCNPFKYLVVTRVTASTLMLPLLVILADMIALMGGFVAFNITQSMTLKSFLMTSFTNIDMRDILPATFKTFLFGFSIGVVGCYEGYNANRGTESVGVAANTAVVISSLMVILIDMVMVQLTSIFL